MKILHYKSHILSKLNQHFPFFFFFWGNTIFIRGYHHNIKSSSCNFIKKIINKRQEWHLIHLTQIFLFDSFPHIVHILFFYFI